MADFNLGGLLGGGGGLYDDLLTPQQQSQLSSRGLLAMAGAFADAGMPSRLPIPLGAAIGKAAAAMGTGRDQAALQVLSAQKLAQEVQTQKITAALQQKMMDEVSKMSLPELMRLHGGAAGTGAAAPGGAPAAAPAAPAVPPAAAAPGAGRNAPLGAVSDLADAGAAADSAVNAMPPPNPSIFGAPGAEALPDLPIKTGGLLGPPDQMVGQPPPGQGLLPRIAAMQQGGGANGWPPFGGSGELPVRLASGGWPFPAIKDAPASIGPPTGYKPDSGPGFPTNPTDRDTSAIPPPNAPNAFAAILSGGPDTASTNADVVLPPASGPRGVSASMLQRVADKGGAAGAPTPPVPPGVDPQAMNTLLLELAKRNAMAEILKLGNPYGSMLSVLQGSPAYQGQIETAKRGAGLPFVGPEEAAKRGAGYPFDVAMEAFKTQNAEYLKDKEQLGAAGLEPAPNGILIRDPSTGAPIRVPGTKLEFAAISRGLGLPRLGIAPLLKAPDGTIIPPAVFPVGEPVFTPQQTKLGEVDAADVIASRTMAKDAAQSIETNKEARALLDAGLFAGAGSDRVTAIAKIGNALNLTGRNTQETVANTEAYLTTVAQNVGRLIKQFGSGTGLSDNDRNYAAEMAAGRQTLDETSIRKILDINDRAGMNVIKTHNRNVADVPRGATLTPLTVPPPTPYQRVYPEGTVLENPTTGEQQIKRGGKWEPVPK